MGGALSSALQVADTADPEGLRWFIAQPIEGGSEKGATTPAASVSIDTRSSVRSLSKHPIHYYRDGDVAFIVEDYVFKLHRSILEAQSNAMKDLYSIGEVHGKEDKVFDDVIAVRLNDSSKDFSNVLDIIYKRRPIPSNRTSPHDQSAAASSTTSNYKANLKLGDLVGVIRVAWKYELEDIATGAVSQLDHLLPLATPQDIPKLNVYKADSGLALAANVVNLSRECQLPRFAPMAFYALATTEWTTDDFQALSSVFPILSAQMHLRLNAGRNGLALPRPTAASNDLASRKREYLTRLRHDELVDILISVDADRTTRIFPDDIQSAIPSRSAGLVEASPVAAPPSPPERDIQAASPPRHQEVEPATSTPPPFCPAQHQHVPPHTSLPGPGNPFMPFLPPHIPHPPFPFPFHQGPGLPAMPPPPPPPVQLHQGLVSQPPSHSIATSSETQLPHSQTPPLPSAHEPTSPSSTPTPHYPGPVEAIPPTAHSSSSLNNGMPSYEEMICMALADLASPDGSAPKAAIAGINGIIDRSQSEVSQPEGEGDTEAQDRESDPEREPDPTTNGIETMEEGDDDAEGETVEGRSSREATEGRDGTSPDRQQAIGGLDHPREHPAVTNQRQNSDDHEEELRSALFLLVDQLRAAAAAASAHA
ncbi:hypothetical protein FRC01_006089 [Tulasnella sp. 417]|nr:hypothetical protein FRC01_006089 [Tulasnella sp. 417]